MRTPPSREFNQELGRAKRAAQEGPVIITDRGRPADVLMRHRTYLRLVGHWPSIRGLLVHLDFVPPRLDDEVLRLSALG
jgi:ATP-dependent helicase YprA (DUF1998 family)